MHNPAKRGISVQCLQEIKDLVFCLGGVVSLYLIPVLLVVAKLLELLRNSRVLGQVDVTLELEDTLGRVRIQHLTVIKDIPGARGTV